jgi:hypothetical protein
MSAAGESRLCIVICIGALIAHREPDHWAVDAIGAPHVGERTEKQLITVFWLCTCANM